MISTGWVDSSIKADPNPLKRNKLLIDETYLANMRERESIFKFIIQTFVFDPKDTVSASKYPILLLGYDSAPLATELSQWNYPVTLAVVGKREENAVKKIMVRHNGTFKITYGSSTGEKIMAWTDINSRLNNAKKFEYINFLVTKCEILVLSIKSAKLRERILKEIKNVNEETKFGGTPLIIMYH